MFLSETFFKNNIKNNTFLIILLNQVAKTVGGEITCECDHLTVFSGSFLVLPNKIDLIQDSSLFLMFFENPVVVSLMMALWLAFLIMLIWARRADKDDDQRVIIL